MPRGLVRNGDVWVETDITPAMIRHANGSNYPTHQTHSPGIVEILHHIVHVDVPGDMCSRVHVTPMSLRTYRVATRDNHIVCATRRDGTLVDYNPRSIALPTIGITQPPTWVICGNTDTGLHLRHTDVFSDIKLNMTKHYVHECAIYVCIRKDGIERRCGTIWFVICNDQDKYIHDFRTYDLSYADDAISARDNAMHLCGLGLNSQLKSAYVYIIYTVEGSVEDITRVPNGSNLFLHLLDDEDAAVYLSNRQN